MQPVRRSWPGLIAFRNEGCRRPRTDKPNARPRPLHFVSDRTPEARGVWKHPLPVPMPGTPCVTTLRRALDQLHRHPAPPEVWCWTDDERRCPPGWPFLASVRAGRRPEAIEAEARAWRAQNPNAWLAVDLRAGAIPPSLREDLETFLQSMGHVIVLVDDIDRAHVWPVWDSPF